MFAVQNSQEQRSQKVAPPSELLASPEVIVTAKKNLFESGEARIQSPSRPPSCKARRTFLFPVALSRLPAAAPGDESLSRSLNLKSADQLNLSKLELPLKFKLSLKI